MIILIIKGIGAMIGFILPAYELLFKKNITHQRGIKKISTLGWIFLFLGVYFGITTIIDANSAEQGNHKLAKEISDSVNMGLRPLPKNPVSDSSPEDQFESKFFIKGVHIPYDVNDKSAYLGLLMGTNIIGYTIPFMKDREYIDLETLKPGFPLKLKLVDHQLFVSCILRDIKTGAIIGDMNFNKWRIRNSGIYHFHDGEDNMEVIDQYGFVVFSMQYLKERNLIKIQGYLLQDTKIHVLTDHGIIANNGVDAKFSINDIKTIKPINIY